MIQDIQAQGWEGWLAPACMECHSTGGGKPPFLTLSFSIRHFCSDLKTPQLMKLLSRDGQFA